MQNLKWRILYPAIGLSGALFLLKDIWPPGLKTLWENYATVIPLAVLFTAISGSLKICESTFGSSLAFWWKLSNLWLACRVFGRKLNERMFKKLCDRFIDNQWLV